MAVVGIDTQKSKDQNAEQGSDQQTKEGEKKVILEEMQVHEVGMKDPHSYRSYNYITVNSVVNGKTFFSDTQLEMIKRTFDETTPFYNYLCTLIKTRYSKDRFGFDVNKLNYDGTSHCKVAIYCMSSRFSNLKQCTDLLQKLIDAGANLSSDEQQEPLFKELFKKEKDIPSSIRKNLYQTPLDYAFEVCPDSLLKLDDLNCTWRGFPDKPPEVSPAVKLLLKAIYSKVKNDTFLTVDAFKKTVDDWFEKNTYGFSFSLIDIIVGYSIAPAIFKFTYRQSDVNQLLQLGRLFCEYDEAMERKQKGEKIVVEKQVAASQNINAIVFGDRTIENSKVKAQSNQPISFEDQTTTQFKNVAAQLAVLRSEQNKMRQELTDQITNQGKLFIEAFKQINEKLQNLTEKNQSLTLKTMSI